MRKMPGRIVRLRNACFGKNHCLFFFLLWICTDSLLFRGYDCGVSLKAIKTQCFNFQVRSTEHRLFIPLLLSLNKPKTCKDVDFIMDLSSLLHEEHTHIYMHIYLCIY